MGNDRGSGTDPTLAGSEVASAATVASDVSDATLAADSVVATAPRAVVGSRPDHANLVEVDRNHYVIGKEIARGGMGRILTARDRRLGREVALKELLVGSGDRRIRFEREARITARLQHPAIVNILEAGVWANGEPFYVMKLVEGQPLDAILAARKTLAERIALLPNAITVVEALAYAHGRRVIHRDLKPANILVGDYGETVVIDWLIRRWVRRHRAAVSVAALAAIALGVGATISVRRIVDEQAATESARMAAVANGERAEVLANFMLEDLRTKLQPAGRVDLLDEVARKTIAYYDSKGQLDDRDRRQRSLALMNLGRALEAKQDLAGATAAIREAHAIREQLLAAQPDDVARIRDLAMAKEAVGDVLLATGQGDEAYRFRTDSLALRDRIVALVPDSLEDQTDRAFSLDRFGDSQASRGRMKDALASYRQSLSARQRAQQLAPSRWHDRAVASSYDKVGWALSGVGDLDGAVASHRAALEIREGLVATDPKNTSWKGDLATSHERIAMVAAQRSELTEAIASRRKQIAVLDELVGFDPKNGIWQVNLADANAALAELLEGSPHVAHAASKRALDILKAQAALSPSNVKIQSKLLRAHRIDATSRHALGDARGAIDQIRGAEEIAERLLSIDAVAYREDCARLYSVIGMLHESSNPVEAARAYRRAVELFRAIYTADSTVDQSSDDLSIALDSLGNSLLPHDRGAALEAFRESERLTVAILAKYPEDAVRLDDLALAKFQVGTALEGSDRAGAKAAYDAALPFAKKPETRAKIEARLAKLPR